MNVFHVFTSLYPREFSLLVEPILRYCCTLITVLQYRSTGRRNILKVVGKTMQYILPLAKILQYSRIHCSSGKYCSIYCSNVTILQQRHYTAVCTAAPSNENTGIQHYFSEAWPREGMAGFTSNPPKLGSGTKSMTPFKFSE